MLFIIDVFVYILPGTKMLACKSIFATPSIGAVLLRAQRANALRIL